MASRLFVCEALEVLLACLTDGTMPVLWQTLKHGAGGNFFALVATIRVVYVAAISHWTTPHIFGFCHESSSRLIAKILSTRMFLIFAELSAEKRCFRLVSGCNAAALQPLRPTVEYSTLKCFSKTACAALRHEVVSAMYVRC